ncbi:protein mono-ADP-ribosyltransferase PARP14-like isoform X2 [Sphaeramia orbicularis]|uniref:protein mono-ADP-ribosyltransferase PARP14-like isoform X2 n=1 Tax=Sphaeramia orbicularis TaxID=375764 RepID=UPI00117E9739|nr:protein mono-ADP-ribosyltransferase PARP14-like isoform X2 [Sphaeramia orbicularis]
MTRLSRFPFQPVTDHHTQETPCDNPNKNLDVSVKTHQNTDEQPSASELQTDVKGRHGMTEEEELCSTSSVLENIPEGLSQEYWEMWVENIMRNPSGSSNPDHITVQVIPDTSSAVITFQSAEENNDFLKRSPQNKKFKEKGLAVRPLEITKQFLVQDVRNFSGDMLQLYFENEGGDVDAVELNEDQSAVITFAEYAAVQKITKKKHHIKKEEIKVYPFYKSLGTALYGKDKPSLKLPTAISQPIDSAIWRFLDLSASAAEAIQRNLAQYFCKVKLECSTAHLSPVPSLLQQKDARSMTKEWADNVKSAFSQALSKYKSLPLKPEPDVWKESERKVREVILNEDVVIVSDEASGVLSVTGPAAVVSRLEETLCEVVNQIAKRAQREKLVVTEEIKVSPSVFNILCQDGIKNKLLSVYPELKFKNDSPHPKITGLRDEILAANKVILDQMFALKRQNLEVDHFVLDMLKDEEPEELTNAFLTPNGINAAFDINAHRVQLLAVSDRALCEAESHLKHLLISQYINVEDNNVMKKPEWKDLVSQIEKNNIESCRKIRIQTQDDQVVVSGHKDDISVVSCKVDDFLKQNAQVEEAVAVKPSAILEYVKKHNTSLQNQVKENVVVSFSKDAICLSGPRCDVEDCKTLVQGFVSSVFFDTLKLSKPGAKRLFQDKEAVYLPAIASETGCLVQLVDEISDGQDASTPIQFPKPVYQLQTPDGVEIVVCKADLCRYPVEAVVCPANEDLKHNGHLSAALLNAGGPQLQEEFDKLIHAKGKFKPGDCAMTCAGGRLCCKKIILAARPELYSDKSLKAQTQLRRVVKSSLSLAEEHGCISVALPVIRKNLGFPLALCASTMVKAVKDHCEDTYDDSCLKRIHFVNNEDSVVQAMENAVRSVFGNHGVSHPQLPTHVAAKSPLVKQATTDRNCLGQVRTKEGLDITVVKGNIESAMTDVIVNTVFEDLALNKGAVSQAILAAAGPKLQQLVKAVKASGSIGDIIDTEGCKLKSKHVFHVITPHWNNGQGTSEKVLSGIFKDCLSKAEESGQRSISFPAIGTGNLGFPKDLVASMMLDEMLTFSSKKQPKHLKEVVIILYSGDTHTIQAFTDEFNKKFPNAGQPAGPTAGPFSKIVSSSGMHETKMGNVAVQITTGDITKETTDVIINSSNNDFTLKSGVSKAILEGAGQAVELECKDLGAQPNSGMIMTQSGNLKCKKILHLVGQTEPAKITNAVKEVLQMCMQNSHTSVSFPAIGTGQGNTRAKLVADAMLDGVIDVLSQNPSSILKTIRIVIFQPPMLKDFYNSMHERQSTQANETKDKGSILHTIGSVFKSWFSSGSSVKPQKQGDFVIEGVKVDPACFHICGGSQNKVDLTKQRISDWISKELSSTVIKDDAILRFSDANQKLIEDIQKKMGVSVRIESKNGQVSLIIEGLSKDVVEASNKIHEMLRSVRDEEDMNKKMEIASTVAEWQYQQQGLQFQSFDLKTNYELEQALEKNQPSVKVTVQGHDYTVTMPSGPATDKKGQTLQIKRIDKLKVIPETWEVMPPSSSTKSFPIAVGTPEYTDIQNLFQATCKQTITKIERIQNLRLWQSYHINKQHMDQKNGKQANNEKRLFHGTSDDTLAIITNHGFNRSYAGKNATAYGKGTYFAVNASYSASNTYSRPNPQGEKHMYLCRVLVGEFTTGKPDLIEPPVKSPGSIDKYDSVVDNIVKPAMFIIFHDNYAYPEYLITFK